MLSPFFSISMQMRLRSKLKFDSFLFADDMAFIIEGKIADQLILSLIEVATAMHLSVNLKKSGVLGLRGFSPRLMRSLLSPNIDIWKFSLMVTEISCLT